MDDAHLHPISELHERNFLARRVRRRVHADGSNDVFRLHCEDAGKYSGPWYDGTYVDLSPFKDRPWWTAEYDGIANVNRVTPWGGNTAPATHTTASVDRANATRLPAG